MPLTAKQIRYFGTPQQKAALRRKRGSSRSTRRPTKGRARVSRKVHHMPKKKTTRSKKTKDSWGDLAAKGNAGIQLAEPFIPAALQAASGDVMGAIQTARPALQEAASFKNVGQIAVPFVVRGFAKKAMRALGVKNPTLFGRKLV